MPIDVGNYDFNILDFMSQEYSEGVDDGIDGIDNSGDYENYEDYYNYNIGLEVGSADLPTT